MQNSIMISPANQAYIQSRTGMTASQTSAPTNLNGQSSEDVFVPSTQGNFMPSPLEGQAVQSTQVSGAQAEESTEPKKTNVKKILAIGAAALAFIGAIIYFAKTGKPLPVEETGENLHRITRRGKQYVLRRGSGIYHVSRHIRPR